MILRALRLHWPKCINSSWLTLQLHVRAAIYDTLFIYNLVKVRLHLTPRGLSWKPSRAYRSLPFAHADNLLSLGSHLLDILSFSFTPTSPPLMLYADDPFSSVPLQISSPQKPFHLPTCTTFSFPMYISQSYLSVFYVQVPPKWPVIEISAVFVATFQFLLFLFSAPLLLSFCLCGIFAQRIPHNCAVIITEGS